jgi:excisionase family DNA binding protein
MEKWITLTEAAELTGYSEGWICRLLNTNRLKGRRWNGRAWQVDKKDALRYAKEPHEKGRPVAARSTKKRLAKLTKS